MALFIATHFAGFAATEALKSSFSIYEAGAYCGAKAGIDPAKVAMVSHLNSTDQLTYPDFVPGAFESAFKKTKVWLGNMPKPTSLLKGAVSSRGGGSGILTVTAVSNLKDKNVPTLSAYPNPTRGVTTLSLSQVGDDNYKIRISNTIGKIVRTIDLKDLNESSEVTLDLSHLPSGVYFYSLLVNEKMIETKRLVLQH